MFFGLRAPTARQRAERQVQVTLVGSLDFTTSSPAIMSAGGQVPRGTGGICTSEALVPKAHSGLLYTLNRNVGTLPTKPRS